MEATQKNDYAWNKLKTVDTSSMEFSIADAVSKLTDYKYSCDIQSITFDVITGGEIRLKLSTKIDLD